MKLLAFLLLFVPVSLLAQTDEHISEALKTGNVKEFCKYLGGDISVKIIDQEDVYSRTQAEMIIRDFFEKNRHQSYTARHCGTSRNGAQYSIGRLVTSTGTYRTSYFTKKNGDSLIIQEFRIEKE